MDDLVVLGARAVTACCGLAMASVFKSPHWLPPTIFHKPMKILFPAMWHRTKGHGFAHREYNLGILKLGMETSVSLAN